MLYLPEKQVTQQAIIRLADFLLLLGGFLMGAFPRGPVFLLGLGAGWYALRYTRKQLEVCRIPIPTEIGRALHFWFGTSLGVLNLISFGWMPSVIAWIGFVFFFMQFKKLTTLYSQKYAA